MLGTALACHFPPGEAWKSASVERPHGRASLGTARVHLDDFSDRCLCRSVFDDSAMALCVCFFEAPTVIRDAADMSAARLQAHQRLARALADWLTFPLSAYQGRLGSIG